MSRPEDADIVFEEGVEEWTDKPQPFPPLAWWHGLSATDQTLYGGLAALAVGLAAIYWPWAFIVPGAVLTALAVFTVVIVSVRKG